MWGKSVFIKHLENEMPAWVKEGLLERAQASAIIARYVPGKDHVSATSAAFGILGVLLLLAGVITFFAANWDGMSKLAKLVLLFGGMLGAYALAIQPFDRASYPRTWSAMLLLGSGMFGANIMLIAQTYHIESHYPNGVLSWALGALLLAWMVPAQPVMVMALALGALWTALETFGFDHYNFAFLVFLLAAAPRIATQGWRVAGHAAALGLLAWSLFAYAQSFDYAEQFSRLLVTELLLVAYLAVFVVGLVMQHHVAARRWAPLVQRYGIFASLVLFYLLTSPWMHEGNRWNAPYREAFPAYGIAMLTVALLVLGGLAAWHHVITRGTERARFLEWARWLLAGCMALLAGTWFVGGEAGGYVAMAFNIFFFAGLAWLVAAGVHLQDRALVNLAFVFFALTLVTRYFDTFWTLLNRSFFFMAGGLLLLGAGFVLERQRRNLTGRINAQRITAAGEGEA